MTRPEDHAPQHHVDRTLRALGEVKPSAGFHARLLRSLDADERSTVAAGSSPEHTGLRPYPFTAGGLNWLRSLAGWQTRGLQLGAACLVASVLLLAIIGPARVWQRTRSSRPTKNNPQVVKQSHAEPDSGPETSRQTAAGATPRDSIAPNESALQPPIRLEIAMPLSPVKPTDSQDDQALADFYAPSKPAPPQPLTAQERLMRLMTRRAERHDLAQLDPAHLELQACEERAAYQKFFEQPPPPRQPPNPSRGPGDPADEPLESVSQPAAAADPDSTAVPNIQIAPQTSTQGHPQ